MLWKQCELEFLMMPAKLNEPRILDFVVCTLFFEPASSLL